MGLLASVSQMGHRGFWVGMSSMGRFSVSIVKCLALLTFRHKVQIAFRNHHDNPRCSHFFPNYPREVVSLLAENFQITCYFKEQCRDLPTGAKI